MKKSLRGFKTALMWLTDPSPVSGPGLEMAWVVRPPETVKTGEVFNVTYSVTASDSFYRWAVDNHIFTHRWVHLTAVILDLNWTDLTNGVQLRSLLVWTVFVCLVPSRLLNKLGGFVNITTVRPTGKMLTERTAASITLTSTPVRWDTWFIHLVIFSFCMSSDVYFTVLLTDKTKV